MSYKTYTKTANKSNYGAKRSTGDIKYIVIHYTGNDGDKALNNATYFKNNIVEASAHYFVDDTAVYQSVPDNYVAWSVGGLKDGNCATTGGGKYYKKCTNANSISIELCDVFKNGKVYPSAKTIANALELTKKLMKKYNIPKSKVIRHFDVTGKSCPAYWCGTTTKNAKWKTAFWNKLSTTASASSTIKAGSSVKIKSGAVYGGASAGKAVPSAYIGKKYTVTKVQTNNNQKEALIKQLNSWVPIKYLTLV